MVCFTRQMSQLQDQKRTLNVIKYGSFSTFENKNRAFLDDLSTEIIEIFSILTGGFKHEFLNIECALLVSSKQACTD